MVKLPCGPIRSGRPQAGLRLSDIDRPFGKTPSGKFIGWKRKCPRGQRVLDAVSGARAGGRMQAVSQAVSKESDTGSFENGIRLKNVMLP